MANLDYVILDMTQVESNLKKNKKMYETNCHFQDAWATKLACVKSMVGVHGKVLLPSEW
jgi:glutaredoxin-related protein